MQADTQLIRFLADGHFHSGEALGRRLGISRAAVWKRLQQATDAFGLDIDAVKGRGYRLRAPLDLLEKKGILQNLSDEDRQTMGNLYLHDTLTSTNTWLMQRGEAGESSGAVCLAEQQLSGRGRRGRQWVSPYGRNIYFSILWRFDFAPMQVAGLSLAAAIGVLRVLHELNCHEAGLKWPNDILWKKRKLAGLLLEVSGESSGPSQVVIGVGLNTYLGEAGMSIDQPWVDLNSIPGIVPFNRNEFAALLISQMIRIISIYQREGLAAFVDEWHRYDLMVGEEVEIRSATQCHHGTHLGIDITGAIRLKTQEGERLFHAGEVSLRGNRVVR
ncbi:MAG: bifunctional biotin--[acetyl-CoA-carboxylase] ligase/biotin operon repressor BirA [Candidatus Thiodiazotropha sp. (ex Monitilora ramsayi)]|nr:bifunctional biotin--[acetyl-CoA-carboxylase] ligase/biotin operon repressor BirA [Candidatus Thiodiazotropha sp. (ex Monitilora ramsayi)]